MYKLHPELEKEINRMNHAETIMKSTFEDELAQIRRHKKSCCNRRRSKLSEPIKNLLQGLGVSTIIMIWIIAMAWLFVTIAK